MLTKSRKLRKLAAGAGSISAIAIATASSAQTEPAPRNNAAEASTSGDIIVTATRRAESISKVPLSITAYG